MLSRKKVTKYWEKCFSTKEVLELEKIFNKSIPKSPWSKVIKVDNDNMPGMFLHYGFFAHPERDIADDSIGIEPKQIKKWLSVNDISLLEDMLLLVNLYYLVYKKERLYKDEDGFIDFNKAFDSLAKKEKSYLKFNETLELVGSMLELKGDNLEFFISNWRETLSIFSNSRVDLINFYDLKVKQWNKFFSYTPKAMSMLLLVNPEYFSLDYIKIFKEVYGITNIMDKGKNIEYLLSIMIMNYPLEDIQNVKNLKFSYFKYRKVSLNGLLNNSLSKESKLRLAPVLLDISESFEILGDNIEHLITNALKYKDPRDIEAYVSAINLIVKKSNSLTKEEVDLLFKFKLREIRYISAGNYSISLLIRYWKTRSKTKVLSNLEMKRNGETISIIDKDNPTALILGDSTDCCQTVVGAGSSCLSAGLINENNGFIVVSRGNQIQAQSWYWTGEYKGRTFICFDSIELLTRNKEKAKSIMSLFESFAKEILKKYDFIDFVCTGLDGHKVPFGVFEENGYEVLKPFNYGQYVKGSKHISNYSDVIELGACIIAEKD